MEKILVTYASRFGSTAGVAQAIARQVVCDGVQAEVRSIGEIGDLTAYSGIIVGGPIHYDRWSSEAADFVVAHVEALRSLPHALFFTCLTLSRKTEKARGQAGAYADAIQALSPAPVPPVVGQFAGKLDYQDLPRFSRPFARTLFAFLGVQEGDHRNWHSIENWTQVALASLKDGS